MQQPLSLSDGVEVVPSALSEQMSTQHLLQLADAQRLAGAVVASTVVLRELLYGDVEQTSPPPLLTSTTPS